MKSMRKQYGSEEGKKVFYASKNKGTIKGVEEGRVDEVAPLIAGVARGLAKVGSVAAKKLAPVAKKTAKKALVRNAKSVADKVRDKSQDEMEENTMKNAYVNKLMEAGPKGKIEAAYGDTPQGKRQYKKLSSRPNDPSPVEAARMKREADAENKKFRRGTMKDNTEYRRIGALMAEAMGLFEMQYSGKSYIPKRMDKENKPKLRIPAGSKVAPRTPLAQKKPGETTAQAIRRDAEEKGKAGKNPRG